MSRRSTSWTQRKVYINTKKELTIGYAHKDVYFYVYIRVNDECPAEAKSKRNSRATRGVRTECRMPITD